MQRVGTNGQRLRIVFYYYRIAVWVTNAGNVAVVRGTSADICILIRECFFYIFGGEWCPNFPVLAHVRESVRCWCE